MNLVERFKENRDSLFNSSLKHKPNIQSIKNELVKIVDSAYISGSNATTHNNRPHRPEEISKYVDKVVSETTPISKLLLELDNHIDTLNNRITSLEDRDKLTDVLDLRERRRFLRYRIYTAVGIASVVFLTAAISHWTGIPLPLLKIPT
jgi:hypothetical protein